MARRAGVAAGRPHRHRRRHRHRARRRRPSPRRRPDHRGVRAIGPTQVALMSAVAVPKVGVPLIAAEDLVKMYVLGDSELRALDGVSLTVGVGEFVAVMGSSGSGKSTLMNVLGCLDRPTAGSYSLCGTEV